MNGSAMDCSEARLHLLDDQRGRLDVTLAGSLAAHLADCAACAREDLAERLLTEQLERRLPQHAAPLALKRRLAAEWATSAPAARPVPARTRRAAVLAAVGLVALLGAIAVAVWVGRPPEADRLVAEAVTDHLRLLARADALDVRSGDVHQLRPWLTSRLDFAPVIPFAGDAEFPCAAAPPSTSSTAAPPRPSTAGASTPSPCSSWAASMTSPGPRRVVR